MIARAVAEAKRLEEVWEAFTAERGLAKIPPPDRRRRAAEVLEALNRRRERLEAKLREPTTVGAVRDRVEAHLADLSQHEEAAWEDVHPSATFADEDEPEFVYFCRCGRETTAPELYAWGLCEVCRSVYRLVHEIDPPKVGG